MQTISNVVFPSFFFVSVFWKWLEIITKGFSFPKSLLQFFVFFQSCTPNFFSSSSCNSYIILTARLYPFGIYFQLHLFSCSTYYATWVGLYYFRIFERFIKPSWMSHGEKITPKHRCFCHLDEKNRLYAVAWVHSNVMWLTVVLIVNGKFGWMMHPCWFASYFVGKQFQRKYVSSF